MSYRLRIPAGTLLAHAGKGYTPPPRWNARTFAEHGAGMIQALARTAKLVQHPAVVDVRKRCRSVFKRQLELLIEEAQRLAGGSTRAAKTTVQQVWLEALDTVFSRVFPELVADVLPPLQSVADQGFTKTDAVMGNERSPGITSFTAPARAIAGRIVAIDDTTRRKLRQTIKEGIDAGEGVREIASRIREAGGGALSDARIATIARTEVSNAWNAGTIASLRQTQNLISIDVIGCESREVDRWGSPSFQQFMFQGEGTCNIQGVSIMDAHLLNFHPNHTGVIVPSEFRDEDGNVTQA